MLLRLEPKIFLPGAFALISIVTTCCLTSYCQSMKSLSAEELTAIAAQPGVGAKAKNVQVVGKGPEVTVLAQKNPSDSANDLKIDAIYLARALFTAAPEQISRVKVLFSQTGIEGRYVTVEKQQVTDYGSGKLSAEQLLSALELRAVHPQKSPDVVSGPEMERRLLAWQRIEKLRQQGTGVKPFEAIFAEIESCAKAGNSTEVTQKVAYLENQLKNQEENLKQAKLKARGVRGVPAASTSSSKTSTGGPMAREGIIPEDADRIKQIYMRNSDQLIRTMETKNRVAAQALRGFKMKIDTCFAAGRNAAAFALLHQFETLVRTQLAIEMFAPEEGGAILGGPAGAGLGQGRPMGSRGGLPGGGLPGGGEPMQGGGPMQGAPRGGMMEGGPMGGGPGGGFPPPPPQ